MIRQKLIAFFRAEIDAEEQWGFPRLNRIPESFLRSPESLQRIERRRKTAYKDYSATISAACHTFVVDAPSIQHTEHPYFQRWQAFKKTLLDDPNLRNVPDSEP